MNTPAVIIEKVVLITDHRGSVFEPVTERELTTQHNAHVVLTAPGFVRGNHYHKQGTEVLVLVGPALVRYREGGVVRDVEVPAGEAIKFTFPPGVPHAFKNIGQGPMLLAAFNSMVHDRAHPDTVAETLIEK